MEYRLLSLGEWIVSHIIPYNRTNDAEELSEEELNELQKIREENHIWR